MAVEDLSARDDFSSRMCDRPPPPRSVGEVGISLNNLIGLALKAMYMNGLDRPSDISRIIKLNNAITMTLLDELKERALVENLGRAGTSEHSELRFALTGKGREWAIEALGQSQYVGPAPVSLDAYHAQIGRQRINLEHVGPEALKASFSDLVVPERLVRRLGPAINSERSMLLYGPPGNGKTTIAEVIGDLFKQIIHIPHAIEVEGTVIKLFDPTIHKAVEDPDATETLSAKVSVRVEDVDRRWVACRRPIVMTGGELTLEMLDLSFNPYARFYEAPLHMKAIGGTYLVDDLGRQIVRPEDLLNRWITPMEKRVDFLTLNTGKTFLVPFDELLIFSTNLLPEDIMDPAFLRRIPYKVELNAPGMAEYRQLFQMLCAKHGLPFEDWIPGYCAEKLQTTFEQPLAFYQPRFIVEQCIASCKYLDRPLAMDRDLLDDAMENLSAKSETAREAVHEPAGGAPGSHTHAKAIQSPYAPQR